MNVWLNMKPFLVGSTCGSIATAVIQPIDMIKVRVQSNAAVGETTNPFTVGSKVIADEGFFALYKGLSAGVLRQVVYTGTRLGLYDLFMERAKGPDGKVSFVNTSLCALSAGGLGALVGNPADLALIRMQTDNMLPVAQRVGYGNVFSALGGIVKSDGPLGLLAGAPPTVVRAMALNLGMLATNSKAKETLAGAGLTGQPLILGSSALAGFMASAMSLPFDYVKTQMQRQKPGADGKLPFASSMDCAMKTMATGGPLKFYAGFPTYYIRIAPHAMLVLILQANAKKMLDARGL